MSTFRARLARAESSADLMHKPEFTAEEVAELFQLSPEVVWQAIWHGELRATILGHQICGIARADLLAWLRANSQE